MKKTLFKTTAVLIVALLVLIPVLGVTASAADNYNTQNATYFVFSDSGISADGQAYTDYTIEGTSLTIKGSGTYVVSGACKDGSIKIKKGTTGVTLVLDGLTLASSETAPITCNKSSEVTIVVASGTTNTLSDSAYNNDEVYTENENAENAVMKFKDGSKVTLCGTGTLNIISNGKNGIKSGSTTDEEGAASLTIKDLTLNITANVNDGINAEAELNILSGDVTVSANDDGIHSDYVLNIGSQGNAGPTVLVKSSTEGIEGATINIYSGVVTVHASDDGINAANSDLTGYGFSISIYGGSVYVDAANGDGIDSNGSLSIYGGTVEVYSASSGDNSPIDADGSVKLDGGTVLAVGAPGMGASINGTAVTFGAGGVGGMNGRFGGMNGGFGGNQGGFPQNNNFGGNGGSAPYARTMSVEMSDQNETSAAALLSPGQQMAGTSNVSIKAGDKIEILDSTGKSVYSATAVRAASCVIFSSSELQSGASYTLSINGTSVATATAGLSTGAGMGMGGMNQGQMPQTDNQFGERPTDNQFGEIPTDNQFGEIPTDNQFGEKPADNQFGEIPTDNQFGEIPTDNQFGEIPTDNQFGERPTDNQFGEIPTDNQFGERPTDNQFSERPTDNQFSERPTELPEKDGDQTAAEQTESFVLPESDSEFISWLRNLINAIINFFNNK